MSLAQDLIAPGVRGLMPYIPGKPIEELQREYGIDHVVKLASNENPLGPGAAAMRAVQQALPDLTRYPDGGGFNLKRALSARLGITSAQITLGNGSNDVLEMIARAFVTPADEVVFSQHAFAVYPIVTQAVGAVARIAPAKDWGHDLAAMRALVNDRTRLIFIANPNNPTGTWLQASELKAFIAGIPSHALIVVDEAYFEYASAPGSGAEDYPDAVRWLGEFPNLIVTRTFSKAYGLAGLRAGYAVSHPDVADVLNRVRQPFNVNSLALVAAAAALGDVDYLHRSIDLNQRGMRQLVTGFKMLGFRHIPSVGNFVCVEVGNEAAAIYQALLRQGVIVRPVANYEMPSHLRVTVGLEDENSRFLTALAAVTGH